VPIIISGLLMIFAYYISKRNKDAGRLIAVLCVTAFIGAACSPLYNDEWLDNSRITIDFGDEPQRTSSTAVSYVNYFEPKESVSIDNINGAITVKGWNESGVKLEYIKQASNQSLLNASEVEIRDNAGKLAIVTNMPEWHYSDLVIVDYTLVLPQNSSADLTLNSVSGDISISNAYLSSEVILKTVSGDMKINGVEAESLLAHTTSGDIDARQSGFDELDIETVSGDAEMDMTLAENARIKTTSGDITFGSRDYDGFRVDAKTISGELDFNPDDMILERRSEKGITASIYPVRYHIELETVSGDVEII